MANLTRAVFRWLMEYAIEMGLRYDNRFNKVPKYRLGTHHTWTDDEMSTLKGDGRSVLVSVLRSRYCCSPDSAEATSSKMRRSY
jgi:hypothetical protein